MELSKRTGGLCQLRQASQDMGPQGERYVLHAWWGCWCDHMMCLSVLAIAIDCLPHHNVIRYNLATKLLHNRY